MGMDLRVLVPTVVGKAPMAWWAQQDIKDAEEGRSSSKRKEARKPVQKDQSGWNARMMENRRRRASYYASHAEKREREAKAAQTAEVARYLSSCRSVTSESFTLSPPSRADVVSTNDAKSPECAPTAIHIGGCDTKGSASGSTLKRLSSASSAGMTSEGGSSFAVSSFVRREAVY